MLKVVGNIKEEAVQTIGDDGVSQQVVAKAGPTCALFEADGGAFIA
ncbi:hypothetical protein [Bacillus sp. FSL K6-2860]